MKVYKRERDGAWQMNYALDGKQKQVYLGKKQSQASAARISSIVEELLTCRYRREITGPKLLRKFKTLDKRLQATLRRHGLISERFVDVTFGELVAMFLESKKDLKQTTIDSYVTKFERAGEFFDNDVLASDITDTDIEEYKSWMLRKEGLAPCTVTRRMYDMRSLFKFAIRKKMLYDNPALEVPPGPMSNDNRFRFVERTTIIESLENCECPELRFALTLARFAGLRMPSEIRNMRFSDFGKDSFFVHEDTKTGRREVPLFPEIAAELEEIRQGRPENDFVFSRGIVKTNVLYKRYEKQLELAGIEKWPRLFNNLRASCITEYDELGFNEKTLDSIFGNSAGIRKRHYVGFRKDRAFMQLLGTKNRIVDELVRFSGNIDTENIDLMIQKLTSLKTSLKASEPVKTGS